MIGEITGAINVIGNVLDEFITTDEERAKAKAALEKALRDYELELKRMETELNKGQLDVNKQEANHASIFVAGWRPAIGWIAAVGLGYTYLVHPLLMWGWALLQSAGLVPMDLTPPPPYDLSQLMGLVAAMLGFGAYRTFEKTKGAARDRL